MIQYRKNTSEGSKKCSQKVDIDKISKKTSIIIGYLKKYQYICSVLKKVTTREQYDAVKAKVEQLIADATAKGMLEPDMDNSYTQEISALSKQMATYEDEYLNIMPLRQKSPLIACIEDYFYAHGLKQKDGAKLLGVNESQFSQIMSGRRRISMSLAKRLHSKLGINAELILEYA